MLQEVYLRSGVGPSRFDAGRASVIDVDIDHRQQPRYRPPSGPRPIGLRRGRSRTWRIEDEGGPSAEALPPNDPPRTARRARPCLLSELDERTQA